MIFEFADWRFRIDVEATRERTTRYSFDHCRCDYCNNFYEAVDRTHPYLRPFLDQFGINVEGPCELMPFEPTLMLACYRLDGQILQWGREQLYVHGIPLVPEVSDDETFLFWVGELEVPWLQQVDPEEVVSPANLPEFLERMQEIWMLRHGDEFVFS